MLQHEICNYTNNFSKLDPKTMPQPSTHIEYSINLQPSQVDDSTCGQHDSVMLSDVAPAPTHKMTVGTIAVSTITHTHTQN